MCVLLQIYIYCIISGEVMSSYLSRMLGLDNVPAVALSLVIDI
jgi:hypothetical protein